MSTYVAFLRAINLGPTNKISMADLRALLDGLGYQDIRTYIQSGNVVLTSPEDDAGAVERRIEDAIASRFALEIAVLVRTPDELANIVRRNPFADADLFRVHVTFLAEEPDAGRVMQIDPNRVAPDEFRVVGREVYLHTPGGYGRSKLNNAALERWLGVRATTRNWKTVTKLLELSSEEREA